MASTSSPDRYIRVRSRERVPDRIVERDSRHAYCSHRFFGESDTVGAAAALAGSRPHPRKDVGRCSTACYAGGCPMSLDVAECERARVARDPSYDGRFFTGVRTTGIYCRPVCPVRPARSTNVQFFPSAAAAEIAGFRPCLRCRPETAPFSSAWIGRRATVEPAIRLILE